MYRRETTNTIHFHLSITSDILLWGFTAFLSDLLPFRIFTNIMDGGTKRLLLTSAERTGASSRCFTGQDKTENEKVY